MLMKIHFHDRICYTKDVIAVFNSFRCDSCDNFFPKHSNFRRHLPVCDNLVRNKYPSSAYHLNETVFRNFPIGTHEPISVSRSSNRIDKPIFICDPEPRLHVEHFMDALQELATNSERDMPTCFIFIFTALCDKITNVSDALSCDQQRSPNTWLLQDSAWSF